MAFLQIPIDLCHECLIRACHGLYNASFTITDSYNTVAYVGSHGLRGRTAHMQPEPAAEPFRTPGPTKLAASDTQCII